MPAAPHRIYKHDGWQGYGHWRGTGTVAHKAQQFLSFKKALLYARSLKQKGQQEWEFLPFKKALLYARSVKL